MKFMLMGLETKGEWERLPQVEREQRVQRHQQALQGLIAQRGLVEGQTLVLTSVGLGLPSEATTVRLNGDQPVLTDGPFAETKEALAGFDLIEFASGNEALAFAKQRCVHGGHVTEIRPVVIDCASKDEAITWARKMSANSGETVEVRPVQSMWSIYHG